MSGPLEGTSPAVTRNRLFFFLSVEGLVKVFVEEVHYSRVFCTQYEGIVRKYEKFGKSP